MELSSYAHWTILPCGRHKEKKQKALAHKKPGQGYSTLNELRGNLVGDDPSYKGGFKGVTNVSCYHDHVTCDSASCIFVNLLNFRMGRICVYSLLLMPRLSQQKARRRVKADVMGPGRSSTRFRSGCVTRLHFLESSRGAVYGRR